MLKAHLIFVVKYRKPLLKHETINNTVIRACENATTRNFQIDFMKSDVNHMHFMINYDTDVTISQIVRRMKQFSSTYVWKHHFKILSKHFWKEKVFWTRGYFVCSVGDASIDVVRKYIENQG